MPAYSGFCSTAMSPAFADSTFALILLTHSLRCGLEEYRQLCWLKPQYGSLRNTECESASIVQPATRAKEVSPVRKRWERRRTEIKPRRGGTAMLLTKDVHLFLSERY